jgi:hypothetical protein
MEMRFRTPKNENGVCASVREGGGHMKGLEVNVDPSGVKR